MKRLLILFTAVITIALTSYAQVEISGAAKNYDDTVFYIREPGGFHNFSRAWRDSRVKVIIDKSGHFKTTVPEAAINTWFIETDKKNQFFDLIKGKRIELIADFSKSVPFFAIGNNADDFNYSTYTADSIRKYRSNQNLDNKMRSKNLDSALFYRKEFAQYKLALLNDYRKRRKISDIYYKWLSSQYLYEPYERMLVENISNRDSIDDKMVQMIMEKGTHDEYAALNTVEYNDLIDFYIRTKYKQKSNGAVTTAKYFDFAANGNLIAGITKDVFFTRLMYLIRNAADSLYTPLFEKYNRIVSNKKMKQAVIDARSDYNSPPTPETLSSYPTMSIAEIFKKHKGTVIYVDFWASWCLPCRAEMPNAEALKNKLKGKNIVFLYFGYKDKEKEWIKARNQLNIGGEHYLLSEKMIKESDEIFNINGIPHYAIIDKEGNIVSKRAGRPNDVYQQLLKLIEQ